MDLRVQLLLSAVMMVPISKAQTDSNHLGDPEPEVTWTPPADESMFKDYAVGARYSGLLWAGRNEFKWLVDIRTVEDDQEFWAVGNLVTSNHVLTTCRAVDILQEGSDSPKEKDTSPSEYAWSKEVYRQGCDLRVYYCRDYLWANGRINAIAFSDLDLKLTGWRAPKEIIRHVLCHSSEHLLLYDAAIIVMNRRIPPIPPRLAYMPTGFDFTTDEVKEMVELDPKKQITYKTHPICYVVSFGRNSANNMEYYTLDYKIKYRVYITSWKDCTDRWKYICSSEDSSCENPDIYDNLDKRTPMCLRPRAKVGTVCDHDKGAPLVCNGQVIGLVVRGAEFRYCNNLYKIPFVAERIEDYRTFLDDSVSYAVEPVPKKTDATTTEDSATGYVVSGTATYVLFRTNPFFILPLALLMGH